MSIRTSESHPIRVDRIPSDVWPFAGRLGLTIAPGKVQRHALTGRWYRDLETDLRRLKDEYATDLLVCLVEAWELEALQIPDLRARAQALGMETAWLPIKDQGIPSDMEGFGALVAQVLEAARSGRNVTVHCKGGLGRSGMLVACCLISAGCDPAEALRVVRKARPGAVETEEQEAFVVRWSPGVWRAGTGRGE